MRDLTHFGEKLEVVSTAVLWVAVCLRSSAAVRFPRQRGLWLGCATAAIAMTLNLSVLHELFVDSPASGHHIGVVRSLIGVISAGAILHFITGTVMDGGRLGLWICAATAAVMVVLLTLDMAAGNTHPPTMAVAEAPVPSLTYWLILIAAHLAADIFCSWICLWYSRTASSLLGWGLRLFGLGTAMSALFWAAMLLRLVFSWDWIAPFASVTLGLHGIFRAAAILAPTASAVRRSAAAISTIWMLWPMWHDLVDAVPHVRLQQRRPRLLEILWPRASWQLLAYRRQVETRDAILVLRDYASCELVHSARRFTASAGIPQSRREAALLASVMHAARQCKIDGGSPTADPDRELGIGHSDRDEEAFLLQAATEYRSPLTKRFSRHLSDVGLGREDN